MASEIDEAREYVETAFNLVSKEYATSDEDHEAIMQEMQLVLKLLDELEQLRDNG